MLPLWRILVRHMTNQLFLYLIALNLFLSVSFLFSPFNFKGTADINWFINPILAVSEPSFYFILGYWIENVLPIHWLTKRNLLYLGMAAIAGTMIASIMTCYHGVVAGGLTEAISERFYDSFLFLNTAFIFCASRLWFITHNISERWQKFSYFLEACLLASCF